MIVSFWANFTKYPKVNWDTTYSGQERSNVNVILSKILNWKLQAIILDEAVLTLMNATFLLAEPKNK